MTNTTNTTNNPQNPMNTSATAFAAGDIVQFSPAFSDGDNDAYFIVEWNGNRGFISPLTPLFTIQPQELVTAEMIQHAPMID
jgi:hypothetical protein